MKMRSLDRLSVCSNQTGFNLPDSMTSATRIGADDSLVLDMVAMEGKLPDGNHGSSRDIWAVSIDLAFFVNKRMLIHCLDLRSLLYLNDMSRIGTIVNSD